MNSYLKITTILLFSLFCCTLSAQDKEVNESCSGHADCESGYCLRTKNGPYCGTCRQSVFESLRDKVKSYCKECESGWKWSKADEYEDRIADDGRVAYETYAILTKKANDCKEARVNLNKTCFKGGESNDQFDHVGQIKQIGRSIDNIKSAQRTAISSKKVYYCSKSTYEGALRNYKRYCNLNFSRIEDDIEDMVDDMEDEKEVDCDDLEDYFDDCKACYKAAKDLLDDGFKNNTSLMPGDYKKALEASEEQMEAAEAALDLAKKEDLCD